jgi:hypothetical protein
VQEGGTSSCRAAGERRLPVVEGFDQEEGALKRMGGLIEEAVGTPFSDSELKRLVREGSIARL